MGPARPCCTGKTGRKLPREFYARPTEVVARELLGQALVRALPGEDGHMLRRGGIVVETEAYLPGDRASHAWRGPTRRNAVMFGPPGHAYVYLIYGVHHCLNAVTEEAGTAGAVLIRAIEPFEPGLRTSGPGLVCRALAIDRSLDGADLDGDALWFEDRGLILPPGDVASGPRIGVAYAGEWADRPLRFWWRGNPHVSRAR